MSAVERMAGRLEGHADVMRCVAKDREDAWAKINGTDLHAWAYTMQQAATQLRALLAEHEALLARVEAAPVGEVMAPVYGEDRWIKADLSNLRVGRRVRLLTDDAAIDAARQGA